MQRHPAPGAHYRSDGTEFVVWAPNVKRVELHLTENGQYILMQPEPGGYHSVTALVQPGTRYLYRLDGEKERPDMASFSQPEDVHAASQVVDLAYDWTDAGWRAPSLRNSVFYQVHVGTYTTEGSFEAIIPHLPRLRDLGITTLQLLPIAQFPGWRNWGYDGVQLYAPHAAYGGVRGLQKLVDAAHNAGLAVFLDLVYNHLGPEGNYLWDYGPYFAHHYLGPWGDSVNFDGAASDPVRYFFIHNALYWLAHYHIDGFRLDATHALYDFSAYPFLEHLTAEIHEWSERNNRRVTVIAENDRSDRRLLLPREANGTGLDAQWLDDLHHTLHVTLTEERKGYYADYTDFSLMHKILREGFAYSGQYSPARNRRHGSASNDIPADRFIICTQNHDQVGNRMLGERLTQLTDYAGLRLAAVLLLTSPYVPLIFMGEEYGETAPFLYFISHMDEKLVQAVREGRAKEFAAFQWQGTPPDPGAIETYQQSKLNHTLRETDHHAMLYALYGTLLQLRREHPALTNPSRADTDVYGNASEQTICLERRETTTALRIFMNWHLEDTNTIAVPGTGRWRRMLDADDPRWRAPDQTLAALPEMLSPRETHRVTLPPKGFAIYRRIS